MANHNPSDALPPGYVTHAHFAALHRRMQRLRAEAGPWSGTLYRVVEPRWSGEADRLSGRGGQQYGGRWNPVGLAAVYGSMSPRDAFDEAIGQAFTYGLRAEQLTPRVIFAFHVKLSAVVDLTDGATRRRLRVSAARMMACPWRRSRRAVAGKHHEALTQAIGRASAAAGIEALRVPSAAAHGGPNLVIFPAALRRSSKLTTVNADQLQG